MLFSSGLIWILLSGIARLESVALAFAFVWYGCLAALAVVDFKLMPHADHILLTRETPERLTVGEEGVVHIGIRSMSDRELRLSVSDSCPASMRISDESSAAQTASVAIEPHRRGGFTYPITAQRRGDHLFGATFVTVHGSLGLVDRQQVAHHAENVKVYPGIADAARFDLMARRGKLQQMGVRRARIQGIGREFESLRDYQPDDEMRRIDWKATARSGRLVSRQYEVEKSQAVIIMLDTGRTMLTDIDGQLKLDYAINAAILLAYVACTSDDLVGLLVFSREVECFIPPKRGKSQLYAIVNKLYNLNATLAEANYRTAISYLHSRWRKRALIVCFTDLWDPDSSRQTIEELGLLQPRHLVAAVTLQDNGLHEAAESSPANVRDAYRQVAAIQGIEDRRLARALLSQRGVLAVDSTPEHLSVELVNRYLQIKDRMMI